MYCSKKNNIKKYSKNLLIGYLVLLTGCTNTIPDSSSKTSLSNIEKQGFEKNHENKYNLPSLDIPEKKEEIKIKKNNIFEPSYNNSQEQTSINSRDKKTGNAVDLQTMAMGDIRVYRWKQVFITN